MRLNQSLQQNQVISKNFILLGITNFAVMLGFQMTQPMMPQFAKSLGGNDMLIGLLMGFFTYSAILSRPLFGNLIETKGRKVIYLFGLIAFTVLMGSYTFLALSSEVIQSAAIALGLLFILRTAQGIGWGASTTASNTIASDMVPASRRGEGMGFFAVSTSLGLLVGPALAEFLNKQLSTEFSTIFLVCAICGLVATLLSLRIQYKHLSPEAAKTTNYRMVFEKAAWKPALLMPLVSFAFGTTLTFLPLYVLAAKIEGFAMYLLLYGFALLLARLFVGKIYDRKGISFLLIPSFITVVIALLLLSWLPNTTVLLTVAIIFGLSFGTIQLALQTWAISSTPVQRRGLAIATFASAYDLGIGTGAIISGIVAQNFGYSVMYLVCAFFVVCSFITFLFMKK